jgi:soluble lytic murein transglycosylase-like protein
MMVSLPISAGEVVTLVNGHQMRAERVEFRDGIARLILGAGALEMPRTAIETIESFADAVAPVVVPAKPADTPVAAATVAPETAPEPRNPEDLLREAADRYGLPPALVRSLARAESNIRQDAISPKGAIGIMQLMPETAARLEADPSNMEQNVDAGARYLRDLLVRYGGSAYKALAAYNAGEKAVDRYNGIPPYEETQTYVRRVLAGYFRDIHPTE